MKQIFICIILTLVFCCAGFAQPDTLWTKKFGGDGDEHPYYVDTTDDNGFIVAGYTTSFGSGGKDIYIVKTDSLGNELWHRVYGGIHHDIAYCIQQTHDHGYILCGNYDCTVLGNDGEVLLMKLNESGSITWTRRYGGIYYDCAKSVQQTQDGGYILTGASNSPNFNDHNIFAIKTNAAGDISWVRKYGTDLDDLGESTRQTADGGYIIAGYSQDPGPVLMNIIKIDAMGRTQWQRYFGRTAEYAWCIRQTYDGGYIVGGSTVAWGPGNHTACLLKLNSFGNTQWFRTYGGPNWDMNYSVRQTKDLGYVFTGVTDLLLGNTHDVYIVKTDINGDTLWTKIMGGPYYDYGECIQALSDDSYIIAARYAETPGNNEFWLIRLEADYDGEAEVEGGDAEISEAGEVDNFFLLEVSPNPFNQRVALEFTLPQAGKVSLKVFDIRGREVESLVNGHLSFGYHEVIWNAEGMASGVYFVRLSVVGGQSSVRKMLLVK